MFEDHYYVIKKWNVGGINKIKVLNEFKNIIQAREYCCQQLGMTYSDNMFDKFKFWRKGDVLQII